MTQDSEKEIAETLITVKKMSKLEKFFGSGLVILAVGFISWVSVKDHVDGEQTKAIESLEVKQEATDKVLNGKIPITDFQVSQITKAMETTSEAVNKFGLQIARNDSSTKQDIRHLQHTLVDVLDMTAAMYQSKTGKKYKSRWED